MYSFLLSFIAGSILPFAFAPFGFWFISLISIGVLFFNWSRSSAKNAFLHGYFFGIGFFALGVSWVFISIHRFGYTSKLLAAIITTGFILFLALFPALNGYLAHKLSSFFRQKLICLYPISFVFFEFLRGWLFTGFPWLFIGYSQIDSPLSGYAPIFSVYGVSLLTAISAGLIVVLLQSKRFLICSLSLLLIWGVGYYLSSISWGKESKDPIGVRMVQGNLLPNDKFLLEDPFATTSQVYLHPSFKNLTSHLIIWPENSLPVPLPYSNEFIDGVDSIAKKHNSALVFGSPVLSEDKQFYNGLIAVGDSTGKYYKQHLVPFGEYLPFDNLLRGTINFFNIPMSNFIPAKKDQPSLYIKKLNLHLLPLICYEIAYPLQVKQSLGNAQAIVNISEDGWFGDSFGPHQHLEIARMRALETNKFILRSTTSGISAIINNHGEIIQQSPQFQQYTLDGKFYATLSNTPWINHGYKLLFLLILFFPLPFCSFRKNNYT